MKISASTLATQAMRQSRIQLERPLPKQKDEAVDTYCALCGREISKDEVRFDWKITTNFNDGPLLANRYGNDACVDCEEVIQRPYLLNMKRCVFSEAGAVIINKHAAISSMLVDPPQPPFVFICNMLSNTQHTIWHAPISFSRDFYYVRHNKTTLPIRREKVLQSVTDVEELTQFMVKLEMKGVGESKFAVFPYFTKEMDAVNCFSIREDLIQEARKIPIEHERVERLKTLKPGEIWAVGMIRISPPDKTLIEPPRLSSKRTKD